VHAAAMSGVIVSGVIVTAVVSGAVGVVLRRGVIVRVVAVRMLLWHGLIAAGRFAGVVMVVVHVFAVLIGCRHRVRPPGGPHDYRLGRIEADSLAMNDASMRIDLSTLAGTCDSR